MEQFRHFGDRETGKVVHKPCLFKAKFHYTDPRGPTRTPPHGLCRRPAQTHRSFSEIRAAKSPCGSGRVRVVECSLYATKSQRATRQSQRLQRLCRAIKSRTRPTKSPRVTSVSLRCLACVAMRRAVCLSVANVLLRVQVCAVDTRARACVYTVFICQQSYLLLFGNKCKKLNSLKHPVRTTVAGSHN